MKFGSSWSDGMHNTFRFIRELSAPLWLDLSVFLNAAVCRVCCVHCGGRRQDLLIQSCIQTLFYWALTMSQKLVVKRSIKAIVKNRLRENVTWCYVFKSVWWWWSMCRLWSKACPNYTSVNSWSDKPFSFTLHQQVEPARKKSGYKLMSRLSWNMTCQ